MKNKPYYLLKPLLASIFMASTNVQAFELQAAQNGVVFTDLQHNHYQLSLVTPSKQTHTLTLSAKNAIVDANALNVKSLEDGTYKFELRPVFDTGSLASEIRKLGDDELRKDFQQEFAGAKKYHGSFAIQNNTMMDNLQENSDKTEVFNEDVIVDGSLCVGINCTGAEVFAFDALRLKEDNLRIKFEDTSTDANFPSNDWQITINDSNSGGINRFSIDDITSGRTPFTIEAGPPSNALYIDNNGDVGISTNSPVTELHIVDGDTPALRLEQDGSSGFGAQAWDIAGNESNFFIRDVTNGSRLPFKILPGADSNALVIDDDNDIGIGFLDPTASLHVRRSDGTSSLLVEETNVNVADRKMLRLSNNGGVRLDFENTSGGSQANNWRLGTENNTGSFIITEVGSGDIEMEITTTGDILARGVVVHSSDVNKKKNIVEVNNQLVLEKVKQLPISTWQYKNQTDGVIHMGPMAQDFRKAFGLGLNDTTISDTDVAGVALASIKALTAELQATKDQQQSMVKAFETALKAAHVRNQQLEKRLFNVEKQLIENNKNKAVASY